MSDYEGVWSEYMNTRWQASDCVECDLDRDKGATACSGCGMPIEQGKRSFWERVAAK